MCLYAHRGFFSVFVRFLGTVSASYSLVCLYCRYTRVPTIHRLRCSRAFRSFLPVFFSIVYLILYPATNSSATGMLFCTAVFNSPSRSLSLSLSLSLSVSLSLFVAQTPFPLLPSSLASSHSSVAGLFIRLPLSCHGFSWPTHRAPPQPRSDNKRRACMYKLELSAARLILSALFLSFLSSSFSSSRSTRSRSCVPFRLYLSSFSFTAFFPISTFESFSSTLLAIGIPIERSILQYTTCTQTSFTHLHCSLVYRKCGIPLISTFTLTSELDFSRILCFFSVFLLPFWFCSFFTVRF